MFLILYLIHVKIVYGMWLVCPSLPHLHIHTQRQTIAHQLLNMDNFISLSIQYVMQTRENSCGTINDEPTNERAEKRIAQCITYPSMCYYFDARMETNVK